MNKIFYKRQPVRKIFFKKDLCVRSVAYGSEIRSAFLEWQRYYYSARGRAGDKMIIAPQGAIEGSPESARGTAIAADPLGALLFGSMRLTLDHGFVCVNGTRTEVFLGPELKAWAILTASQRSSETNYLAVIGRHAEGANTTLSLYPLGSREVEPKAVARRVMPDTTSKESYVICLEKHIFTVHDSRLDYLYFNTDTRELEQVAIGEDSPNETHAECDRVFAKIVASTSGYVFWIAAGQVYGFSVGYPSRLIHIAGSDHESTYDIGCSQDSLLVYRKSKNTSKVLCTRYVKSQDGAFTASNRDGGAENGFTRR